MFYSDNPIASNKEDLLNRNGFAKLLAQSLTNLNSADTFTVGLFRKWGSRKTSLVNLMLQELKNVQVNLDNKKTVIVHFEPWNFSDANQLLSQFFIRLSNEFRSKGDKNLAKIGEALEKYSDAFEITSAVPVVGGLLALLGKKGASGLGGKLKKGSDEKDILKQKEYVVDLLDKQENKILVVIDDIDRLSNEQIRQVFQLITSVARFPNTTYLLVFDKEIVVKALEKVQEGSGEDYLEKIIQMPIQIPDVQKSELRQTFFSRLDVIMNEYNKALFSPNHWQKIYEACIDPFITNLRDVNRLCNAVQFKLTTIASEVNFADMVAISALEIYLPVVYEWIKTNKAVLTGSFDLSSFTLKDKSQNEWYEFFQEQFQSLIHNNKSDVTAEAILLILSQLFPHFGRKIGKSYEAYEYNQFRKNNQIAHSEKFDRYFHLNLDYIGLRKSDIVNAVQSIDCEMFKKILLELDQKGLSYEFLEEVYLMIPEINSDRVMVIAKSLFDVSNCLENVSNRSMFTLGASYYAQDMLLKLIDKLPLEERMEFIRDCLNDATINSISSLASFINMIELGYGRLAANGEEKDYKKIITIEELTQLEKVFCERIKDLLSTVSLFVCIHWEIVSYILECLEPEYFKEYLENVLSNDENVLRYIDSSVTTWTGSDIEYEIKDQYKKYLTEERIIEAIQSQIKTGVMFTLPENIQRKCGAFFLHVDDKVNYRGHISQVDVDELFTKWKEILVVE